MNTDQKPVRDYRKRVGVVLEVMVAHVQTLAGVARRKPEPAELNHLIDVAGHIYNWAATGARRLGYDLPYAHGAQLTESELKAIERMAARLSAMTRAKP